MLRKLFIITALQFLGIFAFAQLPEIKLPTQSSLASKASIGMKSTSKTNIPPSVYHIRDIAKRNQVIIERDMKRLEERLRSERKRNTDIENILKQEVNYSLPLLKNLKGTQSYYQAKDELVSMLEGKQELSLIKAVYLVENAFFENTADFQTYDKSIANIAAFCERAMAQEGVNEIDDLAKNMMIFRFFADTLEVKDNSAEETVKHFPIRYDFDDIFGKQDWTKMFVIKTIMTQSGQCHSLPLLYLSIVEKMNSGNAWLAFSPSHTYVKVKGRDGNLYNLELTAGKITSDYWVVGSGFVKSEAIRNEIYLDTLSKRETIATSLADLANGYIWKYGYDPFVKDCIDKALEYHPNNIYALKIKANYNTVHFGYVNKQMIQRGVDNLEKLRQFPKAMEILEQRNKTYRQIDNLGFSEMPPEAYQDWLQSIEQEKFKQEHQSGLMNLQKSIIK